MKEQYITRVLEWMNKQYRFDTVVAIDSVDARGSDWEGDTEGGFYNSFEVRITYILPDGKKDVFYCQGEDMASLWNYVLE